MGNMRRAERQGALQVGARLRNILFWKPIHEIQIEIAESCGVRLLGRSYRISRTVNTSQDLEMSRVETLDADRQPGDPGRTVFGKSAPFDCPGISFQGDFYAFRDRQVLAHCPNNTIDVLRLKQARGATPQE